MIRGDSANHPAWVARYGWLPRRSRSLPGGSHEGSTARRRHAPHPRPPRCPSRVPARRWCTCTPRGCATPTSTSPAATGPAFPAAGRSATKASASSRRSVPGAEQFVSVGDRVILGLGGAGGAYWCGACRHCISGHPRLCVKTQALMGTFAEYLPVWAPALVKIPDSLSDNEAPLACGGLTAYGAVKKLLAHHVVPGRPIAVVGAAGGLGHYAVQIAVRVRLRGHRHRRRRGAARLREVARRVDGARMPTKRSTWSAASRWRRREPHLLREDGRLPARLRRAWASTALMVCVGPAGDERGQHRDQPVRVLRQGRDDHLLGRRHRAGHARARRPRRGRQGEEPRLAHRARSPSSPRSSTSSKPRSSRSRRAHRPLRADGLDTHHVVQVRRHDDAARSRPVAATAA